jgi:5-methylcytosine-specific restriction endonuclease McrA
MYYFYAEVQDGKLIEFEKAINKMLEFIFSGGESGEEVDWSIFTKGKKLYNIFIVLSKTYNSLDKLKKDKLRSAYFENRRIADICKGVVSPITYDQIDKKIRSIIQELEEYLYKEALNLKTLNTAKLDHYHRFIYKIKRKHYTCPFCGIERFETEYSSLREDFDHFLMRSKYPFTSINTLNLVPMCKKCNQIYKSQFDIASLSKIFYPFQKQDLEYDIVYSDNGLEISRKSFEEEILNWNKIFKVTDRSNHQIKALNAVWFENDIEIINSKYNIDIERLLSERRDEMKNQIFELGHLKSAFFDYLLRKREKNI